MFNRINEFLSSTEHTGYQTIFIGVITTIVTSAIIINCKFIWSILSKLISKIYKKISRPISYYYRLVNYKRLERLDISKLQEKDISNKINKLESRVLERYMKHRLIQEEFSMGDIKYLQKKRDKGELKPEQTKYLDKCEKQMEELGQKFKKSFDSIKASENLFLSTSLSSMINRDVFKI